MVAGKTLGVLVALLALVVLSACGEGREGSDSLGLSLNSSRVMLSAGFEAELIITRTGGTGTGSVEATGIPEGIEADLSAPDLAAGEATSLLLQAGSSAAAGQYEVTIELRAGGEQIVSTLDLVVHEPSQAVETFSPLQGELRSIDLGEQQFTYEVIEGTAVYQGDMVLGPAEAVATTAAKIATQGTIIADDACTILGFLNCDPRWPGGIIPYEIDSSAWGKFHAFKSEHVEAAVDHWNENTVVQLVPREASDDDYVVFVESSGCSSYVGRQGGRQEIRLAMGCGEAAIIHEIGHAAGLFHEHTRPDRSHNVEVLWVNINPLRHNNFQIPSFSEVSGPYDYGSIMHYPTHAFSWNGNPTLRTIPPGMTIGQRVGLSIGDIAAVQRMYGQVDTNFAPDISHFEATPGKPTVDQSVTFSWDVGDRDEEQTLACRLDVDGDGNTDYERTGGDCRGSNNLEHAYDEAQQYDVTLTVVDIPDELGVSQATIQVPVTDDSSTITYPLVIEVDGIGTVTSNPIGINCGSTCTADFDEGTSVTLTATAASGWTFDTWVGDADCNDGRVDMTAPTACTATFTEATRGEVGSVAWQVGTGDVVVSSPAIGSDGVVFVGSNDGHLYAVNGADGDVLWQYPVPGGVFSSPAVTAEGTVVFGGADDFVYAVDSSGDLQWRYETVTDAPAVGGNGVVSSPAIGADGTIYVGASDGYLYALSAGGQLEWRYPTGYRIQAGPSIGADGTVYFGSRNGTLYALEPDGTLQWSYATGDEIRSSVAIDSDGSLYVGSFDGYLYKFNSSGGVEWRHNATASVYSSPAVGDGRVYVGTSAGDLAAIDSDTGGVLWRFGAGGPVPSSPALGDDGTIVVGSNNGFLNALSVDGTLLWRHEATARVYSSPNIGSNGLVYVGSNDGHLYAVHTAANGLASTPWPSIHRNQANNGR